MNNAQKFEKSASRQIVVISPLALRIRSQRQPRRRRKLHMITDIPKPEDFRHAGTAYLNLAWSTCLELANNLDDANSDNPLEDITDEYWKASQRPLATAVSLIQQGTEFLLKARIAEVSPFLLFAGSPSEWPRHRNRTDIPFSEFKTIQADELIRVCNTVSTVSLSDEFKHRFERLRRIRNTVMHTVDPRLRFNATEIIESILEVSDELIEARIWTAIRRTFLENEPNSVAYSPDHVDPLLALECLSVISMLKPAQLTKHFQFNPRQRRYFCLQCTLASRDWDLRVITAQLLPNTPSSTSLYCFVCRRTEVVSRKDCPEENCHGNVIYEDGTCLTCLN